MPSESNADKELHFVRFTALGKTVSGFTEAITDEGSPVVRIKGAIDLDLGKDRLSLGVIEVEVGLKRAFPGGDTSTVIIGVT